MIMQIFKTVANLNLTPTKGKDPLYLLALYRVYTFLIGIGA